MCLKTVIKWIKDWCCNTVSFVPSAGVFCVEEYGVDIPSCFPPWKDFSWRQRVSLIDKVCRDDNRPIYPLVDIPPCFPSLEDVSSGLFLVQVRSRR